MQTFEIVGQTDQSPFASSVGQTSKRELAEVQHLLDDANDRFHRGFAQAVEGIANLGTELVGHFLFGGSIFGWRRGFVCKEPLPTLMMRRSTCGNVWFNLPCFEALNVVLAEIAGIQIGVFQLAQVRRHRVDCRQRCLLVIGLIAQL